MVMLSSPAPTRVLVPRLVGADTLRALKLAVLTRLVLTGPDRDTVLPLTAMVTAQTPAPGTPVEEGHTVTVWTTASEPLTRRGRAARVRS